MIEINLVPDVKQELIRAKHVRNLVVSGAVVVGIASVAVVILLAVYLFGVQTLRSSLADSSIKDKEKSLQAVPDLANMLTIQSQLANIATLHNQENASSRLFNLLIAINPPTPNNVTLSTVRFDADQGTIHLDGQAANGFVAADVFKKTIAATKFSYTSDGKTTSGLVADGDITVSNLSYGEDTTGAKVLRFSLDFTYDPALFVSSSQDVKLTPLGLQNATDSFKYLPTSLFSSRATDIGGGQ
jgi:hypothetical protein